ncbi:alpha-mannosidase [Paenibacillus sp.]|uniref:alpha-mannosidase n=1 Tax=Paenibacillus sp. TaxID=58172 RepID=UPI002811E664|nr:alpha-mannosidase [Paenibacillus sp.]
MTAQRTAHLVSHTHWDREWYLPYERHHVRLIQLMDDLFETLRTDPDYKSFHLDGQTIILEDYLQVRPERKEELERWIREGRIRIGPWYILQDAFLTSSEANLRNLLIGHQDARRYGAIEKVGYFPDTFGNIGQAPQMMKQAGIDNAVFGRGVKPTGFNNTVADGDYESSFSELIWEGPDGSQVLGLLFANWYSNGNEVPTSPEEAKAYWERKLADAEKYASTDQLLFMNGCDHQPIQKDLPEALRLARELYPDTAFVHSSFEEYLAALQRSLPERLSVVKGELRSQRTDGWGTLVNTASARVYLKQLNQTGQAMLEKVAEPLATFAAWLGKPYPHHLFTYAWKTLMQNHPHDSICGCSVDEVHREMITRFDKSRHVAEAIAEESKRYVAEAVDTSGFATFGADAVPFVVFNTTGWARSGTVEVELELERLYYRDGVPQQEMIRRMKAIELSGRLLVDASGNAIPYAMEDLGVHFGYDLPDDKFRQPYWARKAKIAFEAARVPALGVAAYAIVRSERAAAASPDSLLRGDRALENELLRVEIGDDGALRVTDKTTGRTYSDLCVYEDTGDIGNEYMYKQPNGEAALTTKGLSATIRTVLDRPDRATIEIVHDWHVPASADERFEEEMREAVYFPERQGQRVERTVPLTIRTRVSLRRSGKGVEVETSFTNLAKDHRVRALFPTDLATNLHRADSIFEVAARENEPSAEWTNPSYCHHQQAFVDVSDDRGGLTIANLGLHEYEIVRDGRNTIAVTLLRAVAELGDWGVFPTPEAQCLGDHKFLMEIIPHAGDGAKTGAYAEAYQFQAPWTVCQTGVHAGAVASGYAPIGWEGDGVAFSSLKFSEESGHATVRWYNMTGETSEVALVLGHGVERAYKSDVLEQVGDVVETDAEGRCTLPIGPCEILTIGVHKK